MKIVVVGGNGFIGRHFVRVAVEAGHIVTVVARPGASAVGLHPGARLDDRGLEGFVSDSVGFPDDQIVCHFASSSAPASSNKDPADDVQNNLVPLIRLLEAMRASNNKRIVYLSSGGAVYGRPVSLPISEDHPLNPISSYGVVKGAAEKYLAMYADLHGFETTVIRPSNPYGPGQAATKQVGLISALLNATLEGREAVIFGDGSTVRDYVYVDDLCDLILRTITTTVTGTFNCGSGEGRSILEIMEMVESVTRRPLERRSLPPRPSDPPSIVLDTARAADELGWAPQISLREGVERTWRSMNGSEQLLFRDLVS